MCHLLRKTKASKCGQQRSNPYISATEEGTKIQQPFKFIIYQQSLQSTWDVVDIDITEPKLKGNFQSVWNGTGGHFFDASVFTGYGCSKNKMHL